ncbi:hypothetical protein K8R43_00815 [archaeon]|nr:hypothetical protein [archaeon]
MENKRVLLCPNCGSTEVKRDNSNLAAIRFGAPIWMKCQACGFKSPAFLEVKPEEVEKIREEIKNAIKEEQDLNQ